MCILKVIVVSVSYHVAIISKESASQPLFTLMIITQKEIKLHYTTIYSTHKESLNSTTSVIKELMYVQSHTDIKYEGRLHHRHGKDTQNKSNQIIMKSFVSRISAVCEERKWDAMSYQHEVFFCWFYVCKLHIGEHGRGNKHCSL